MILTAFGRCRAATHARGMACTAVLVVAGCLPSALDEPQPGGMDQALVGTWLARGGKLEEFNRHGVDHGPGTEQQLYLVGALDDRSYHVTWLEYYLTDDGHVVPVLLTQWKSWLVPLGDRQYLVCRHIAFHAPLDPDDGTPGEEPEQFPTFEIKMVAPDAIRVVPVVIPDVTGKLGGLRSPEDRAAALRRWITAEPDAAASEEGAQNLHRMQESTERHVQHVLEAFHLVNRDERPEKFTPAEGNGT